MHESHISVFYDIQDTEFSSQFLVLNKDTLDMTI